MSETTSAKWWTRRVVYPNISLGAFLVAATLFIIGAATGTIDPFLAGMAAGFFVTTTFHEVGMRYRVHKFGRV